MANPMPSSIGYGSLFYGFGVGHARQGRYAERGWIYTVVDSLIIGGAVYGFASNQTNMALPLLLVGLPFSHVIQYADAYFYYFDHQGPAIQNLKTQNGSAGFILSWNF